MSGATSLLIVSVAVPVVGLVAAVAGRWLIARIRPPRLGWAASTLCGIVGSAAASAGVALALDRPARAVLVPVVLASVLATALVLGVADSVVGRRSPPVLTVRQLVAAGESTRVEFKSSARVNRHTGVRDTRLENVVAATVAGLFNAEGGDLVLGVADDGTIVGLAEDFALQRKQDRDGFELWLRDLLAGALGAPNAQAVRIDFEDLDGPDVCVVRVPAARRPVFLRLPKQPGTEFLVRVGNSTRRLDARDTVEYAAGHWSRRVLLRRRARGRLVRTGSPDPARPPDPAPITRSA